MSYLLSVTCYPQHADRHVVDISFTVCFFVCLFLCPQEFCNGYLRRGWTYGGETLEDGGPRCPPGHLPFW